MSPLPSEKEAKQFEKRMKRQRRRSGLFGVISTIVGLGVAWWVWTAFIAR